jgi:ABC-type multidrug transport system fused ATPase/permease subunit
MTIKKILDLFSSKEKKSFYILIFLLNIVAILDVLGVASILPFITVLTNSSVIEENFIISELYKFSNIVGVNNEEEFLFLLGISVFIMLIISITFRALSTYALVRFTLMKEYTLGKNLIEGYLHQPYEWFLERHSADLGKSILSETKQVINGVLVPFMNLIAQSSVTFALLTLLLIVDPFLAISVGLILALSYFLIFFLMKKFLLIIGYERLKANEQRFTSVSETFSAIKEIKLARLENFFINRFVKPARIYASNQASAEIISQLPKFLLEVIAFGGMILLVLIMMSTKADFNDVIPIIALYALAGYRLMPALQQIYGSFTQLRFSSPALVSLHKELLSLNKSSSKLKKIHNNKKIMNEINLTLKKSIELKKVNFNYPGSKKKSLKNIDIIIPAGNKIGIVGTTGSGKTTLVDLILGLLDAQEGILSVDGQQIDMTNKKTWQKKIGYVPQQIYLSDTSVAENIAFGIDPIDIDLKKLHRVSKIANFHDFVINDLNDSYNSIIGENGVKLSGGQRQRIGIARALYHDPDILILDEATSSLDNITEKIVMEAVNNLRDGMTIIIIAHRLSTVKNCQTIFLLEGGELKAQGSYEDLSKFSDSFIKIKEVSI